MWQTIWNNWIILSTTIHSQKGQLKIIFWHWTLKNGGLLILPLYTRATFYKAWTSEVEQRYGLYCRWVPETLYEIGPKSCLIICATRKLKKLFQPNTNEPFAILVPFFFRQHTKHEKNVRNFFIFPLLLPKSCLLLLKLFKVSASLSYARCASSRSRMFILADVVCKQQQDLLPKM